TLFRFMNQSRYDQLPEDLKQVIDDSIGPAAAEEMAIAWNEVEKPGEGMQIDSGGEILHLDADAKAAFDAAGERVVAKWIEEANARGVDGAALVEAARK